MPRLPALGDVAAVAEALAEPAGDEGGAPVTYPWAGGNTSDFGGSCAPCVEPKLEQVPLDDATLGFSAAEVLDVVAGVHAGAAEWRDVCAADGCNELDRGCPREAPDFAGGETELQIEGVPGGTATLQTCPARDEELYCNGRMLRLPIEATVRTADGLLEASEHEDLIVVRGEELGLGGAPTAAEMTGSLAERLPEVTYVEWSLWFGPEGPQADIYVLGAMNGVHADNLLHLRSPGSADDCSGSIDLAR